MKTFYLSTGPLHALKVVLCLHATHCLTIQDRFISLKNIDASEFLLYEGLDMFQSSNLRMFKPLIVSIATVIDSAIVVSFLKVCQM